MSRDIIIFIQCPEIMECPLHQNESQVIDGILKDICDILKYSFIINENRTLTYFGRKIDLDYKIEKSSKTIDTILKYSFILKDRSIPCECNITKVLDDLKYEKIFLNDYTNLIKFIVKDIGEKSIKINNTCYPIQLKYADLKRHYNK